MIIVYKSAVKIERLVILVMYRRREELKNGVATKLVDEEPWAMGHGHWGWRVA
jgi:hypothetical protein